jgi:hypothetical protein
VEPVDGQTSSTRPDDGQASQPNRSMVNLEESTDQEEEKGDWRIHQGQDMVEAGQSMINNGSESVLQEFDSCMSHFIFGSVCLFICK